MLVSMEVILAACNGTETECLLSGKKLCNLKMDLEVLT